MKRLIPFTWLLAGMVIFLAGLARIIGLGQSPLTPLEANAALAAADWAGLASPFWEVPSSFIAPAYQTFTGALMAVFGATEFIARLTPAIFGLALAILPLALGSTVSWPVRLLTSLLLGFSATTLTASRTADGTALAAIGVGLALVASIRRRDSAAKRDLVLGSGLGLALAAGSDAWMGFFSLAVAAILGVVIPAPQGETPGESKAAKLQDFMSWRTGLAALLVGVLLSSALGANATGIAGLLEAPANWLLGWSGIAGWQLFTAFLIPILYEPLLIAFGAYGAVKSLRSGGWIERNTSLWAIGALAVYLIYPGRQPQHLIWMIIPLAVLAASQIENIADRIIQKQVPLSSLLLALVLVTVLAFAYLQLEASAAGFGLASLDREAQFAFAVSALAFSGLLIVLFGIGWSWPETLLALAVTLLVSLAGLSVNAAWKLNFSPGEPRANELWRRQVSTAHLPLLEDTLADIAKWYVGRDDRLPVEVQGPISAPLAWALRDHQPASAAETLESPPVVIAPETASVELPADYLGQAFAIGESWGWQGVLPPDTLRWLLDRQAPVHEERWILFVRKDVAELGGQTELNGSG